MSYSKGSALYLKGKWLWECGGNESGSISGQMGEAEAMGGGFSGITPITGYEGLTENNAY